MAHPLRTPDDLRAGASPASSRPVELARGPKTTTVVQLRAGRGSGRLKISGDSVMMYGALLVTLATLTGQSSTGDPASSLSGSFSTLKEVLDANRRDYKEACGRAA